MARRRNSAFEDLIEIAAALPWWLSLSLAAVSYVVMHYYAGIPVPVITDTKQLGSMVTGQMIKTLATFGQYLVPLAFGIGAFVSIIKRKKRANLFQSVTKQAGKSALNGITWREFEMLVGEWFRRQGYTVTETGGVADGGVDLILTKAGETYLVQCKHWKAYKVGVNVVRELLGVMVTRSAAGGYLVTSGVFTDEARRFAEASNIVLIDGEKLAYLLSETRAAQPTPPGRPLDDRYTAAGFTLMPQMWIHDGDPPCYKRHACRQHLLGLFALSRLSGYSLALLKSHSSADILNQKEEVIRVGCRREEIKMFIKTFRRVVLGMNQ